MRHFRSHYAWGSGWGSGWAGARAGRHIVVERLMVKEELGEQTQALAVHLPRRQRGKRLGSDAPYISGPTRGSSGQ